MKTSANILFALLLLCRSGHAQGFVNLNFEAAKIIPDSSSGYGINSTNAIPGWTPYYQGVPYPNSDLFYNTISLGAPSVDLEGTNGPVPQIQGKYYVLVQGGYNTGGSAGIGQTGQIPSTALSLILWGYVGDVTFNGQPLTFNVLASTPNYDIEGADISAFAGQTGLLLFTAEDGRNNSLLEGQWDYIDNIQFSSSPVPEPATLALAALGTGLFAGLRRRQHLH